MTFRSLLLFGFSALAGLPGQASGVFPTTAVPADPLPGWAGKDAVEAGFTEPQVRAFLTARATDLRAGVREPWASWLRGLDRASNPSVKVWALARRLEAGELGVFTAFQTAAFDHTLGISKRESGRSGALVADPPGLCGLSMPPTLRIHPESVFWRSFEKTLREGALDQLGPAAYSVWCYGTYPGQRELVHLAASKVVPRPLPGRPEPSPWNDPRFWIVVDWAFAWGTREDFRFLEEALPKGPAREVFAGLARTAGELPGFLDQAPALLEGEGRSHGAPAGSGKEPGNPSEPPLLITFSAIKVAHMPPPPPYPAEAKLRRMMTHLHLMISIDREGKPIGVRPLPGPWMAFFAPAGISYAMNWRFEPARMNGEPIPARFHLRMPFQLR